MGEQRPKEQGGDDDTNIYREPFAVSKILRSLFGRTRMGSGLFVRIREKHFRLPCEPWERKLFFSITATKFPFRSDATKITGT